MYLLFLLASLLFLVVNLACALLVRTSSTDARAIVLVRVAINDTLFVLSAVSLSVCLYKIAKMSLANIYLESKVRRVRALPHPARTKPCTSVLLLQGTSVCQVTGVGAVVILLYASRACYNLVVLALSNKSINSFDYDWYNVSDQVRQRILGNVWAEVMLAAAGLRSRRFLVPVPVQTRLGRCSGGRGRGQNTLRALPRCP